MPKLTNDLRQVVPAQELVAINSLCLPCQVMCVSAMPPFLLPASTTTVNIAVILLAAPSSNPPHLSSLSSHNHPDHRVHRTTRTPPGTIAPPRAICGWCSSLITGVRTDVGISSNRSYLPDRLQFSKREQQWRRRWEDRRPSFAQKIEGCKERKPVARGTRKNLVFRQTEEHFFILNRTHIFICTQIHL
ncbi:hypothetical protein NL676_007261 [Syzygium grande]|nr:hypothetical protein NL676_007261 [Syzygium grande]